MRPLSAGETEMTLTLLAPKDQLTDAYSSHWAQNHDITKRTLMEDWVLNEGIQRGGRSAANEHYTLGRFEGALTLFNQQIEHWIKS